MVRGFQDELKACVTQFQGHFTIPEHQLTEDHPVLEVQCVSLSPTKLSSVQSLSRVQLFLQPHGLQHHQASLSITSCRSLLKLTSIELVVPSSHLILCCRLLFLPSVFPRIRVFSNESVFHIRWPKYWSFSFSTIPSKEIPGLISFRMDWLDLLLQSKGLSRVFSNTTVQEH